MYAAPAAMPFANGLRGNQSVVVVQFLFIAAAASLFVDCGVVNLGYITLDRVCHTQNERRVIGKQRCKLEGFISLRFPLFMASPPT